MIGILRLLVVLGGIFGGAFYFVKNILGAEQWRKGISAGDVRLLKDVLIKGDDRLVDLDKDELKLLSLNNEKKLTKNGGKKISSGTFFSIYDEALLNYTRIDYDQHQSLILASTLEQDYVFKVSQSRTDIYCNGNLLAHLDEQGLLRSINKNEVLLQIETSVELKFQRITTDGKEIAAILNPLVAEGPSQRVIQYEEMHLFKDQNLLNGVIFLNMIQRT